MADNDGGVIFRGGVAFIDDGQDRVADNVKLEDLPGGGGATDAAVAGQIEAGEQTGLELDAKFLRRQVHRLVAAAAIIPRPLPAAYPALYAGSVTVNFIQNGTSTLPAGAIQQRVEAPQSMTFLGIVPLYFDTPRFTMESYAPNRGSYAHSHDVVSAKSEYFYRTGMGSGTYWVWIDDQPVTAAPVPWVISGSVGVTHHIEVIFPGIESHRVTIKTDGLALQVAQVAAGESINAAPRPPVRAMATGDSLTEGGTLEAIPMLTWVHHARQLTGWDWVMNAVGGAGAVTPGPSGKPFTFVDRLTALADPTIDLHVFDGSVNDDDVPAATLTAAWELCFSTIFNANPYAKVIVIGPSPTNAATTLAASRRANIDAVRAAAMLWSDRNVIAFIDPTMTKNVVGAWSGGMVLAKGQRVSHLGGIYEATRATNTGAFGAIDFGRISPFFGTGRMGAVANNGNRDVFILSDDTHWSLAGHRYMGHWFVERIRAALVAFGRGDFYLFE